jgi:(E)-4-hydroxy-3-methylbut-2-enyl-diphosphate synthase
MLTVDKSPIQSVYYPGHNPLGITRRKTRVVHVGQVAVGGDNPLRIQSMTTALTMDTEATVAETLRLVQAGCEIVRITAPTVREARNLEKIKSALVQKGCQVPLVADIHFRPDAALLAAEFVEKVRINPGNFVDSKAFKKREYTDEEYINELRRIEEKFTPLVQKLKKFNRSLRIGTNHGSLSDRILNRFGDTPLGMVESALEYVRICEKNNYHDIILSMKASNPRVMIAAYRLLAARMTQENMDYPFHLGVTEAGEGEDGRIKSAVGIGSLLEDGIGDTIRVSLTEPPEAEIPVAKELAKIYAPFTLLSPPDGGRGKSRSAGSDWVRGTSPVRVMTQSSASQLGSKQLLKEVEEAEGQEQPIEIIEVAYSHEGFEQSFSRFQENIKHLKSSPAIWVSFNSQNLPEEFRLKVDGLVMNYEKDVPHKAWETILGWTKGSQGVVILRSPYVSSLFKSARLLQSYEVPFLLSLSGSLHPRWVQDHRRLVKELKAAQMSPPIVLMPDGSFSNLEGASKVGSLLCDGIGDVVGVPCAYGILQACGVRITKTEYVSCPSCGRTLFDLPSTTERIRSKTQHLKGVKIAIMGCIVNGPGEMADADFGYVGGGPGKINLYVGKTCVEKSIPTQDADQKLIDLIKAHGKWREPNHS